VTNIKWCLVNELNSRSVDYARVHAVHRHAHTCIRAHTLARYTGVKRARLLYIQLVTLTPNYSSRAQILGGGSDVLVFVGKSTRITALRFRENQTTERDPWGRRNRDSRVSFTLNVSSRELCHLCIISVFVVSNVHVRSVLRPAK
jgi:hypothetical protein